MSSTEPAAEQTAPELYFQGLCRSGDRQFLWALGNFGDEPVDVEVRLEGVLVDTFSLDAGELVGFGTADPGRAEALVGGVVVAEAFSNEADCPVGEQDVGMGGLCFDAGTGYRWLVGNGGTEPVQVEVRLEGDVVGIFDLDAPGLASFTTEQGGTAQAFVDGVMVAEADSNDFPCNPPPRPPLVIEDACFEPGVGYRWSVSRNPFDLFDEPLEFELVIDGVSQGVFTTGPFGFSEVVTSVGGTAEVLVEGEVVDTAESSDVLCLSSVFLSGQCVDVDGLVWRLENGDSAAVTVRLELDGVVVGVETLDAYERREATTADGETLRAYLGEQLMAEAQRAEEPCVVLKTVCADPVGGHVWAVTSNRSQPVQVEVRLNGTVVDVFDFGVNEYREYDYYEFVTADGGTAQAFVDGVLVAEVEGTDEACPPPELLGACFEPGQGHVWAFGNPLPFARDVELRLNGVPQGSFTLAPYEYQELITPTGGTMDMLIAGEVVTTAQSSDDLCPPPEVFGSCFDPSRGYVWSVGNPIRLSREVELRLNGASLGSYQLAPDEFREVVTATGGTMEVVFGGQVVNTAESNDEPCFGPPPSPPPTSPPPTARPAVLPATLPSTGGGHPWLALSGAVLLGLGLVMAAVGRADRRESGLSSNTRSS